MQSGSDAGQKENVIPGKRGCVGGRKGDQEGSGKELLHQKNLIKLDSKAGARDLANAARRST